jgi:hypothetical protein
LPKESESRIPDMRMVSRVAAGSVKSGAGSPTLGWAEAEATPPAAQRKRRETRNRLGKNMGTPDVI